MIDEALHLHFVLDARSTRWHDIEQLDEADIARSPGRFVGGRNSWIAQSFVRLRGAIEARGWIATAGPGFVPGAICVAHRDDVNRFFSLAHASFLLVVRADRAPVSACDLAIVQNALAPERHERFVPLWPQPGLLERDAARGTRIERIAYLGRTGAAPAWFRDGRLSRGLEWRGVEFEVRERSWENYRDVDLALAARSELPRMLGSKPATKLYNAWLAGVPALASPEPAYRELRRAAIDFIEVLDADDVLAAVDLLRANPALYLAMVENGRRRAVDFTVGAIRGRWLALLESEVVPCFLQRRRRLGSRRAWFLAAMAMQKGRSRMFRIEREAQAWMRSPPAPARLLAGLGRLIARSLRPSAPPSRARRGELSR